MPTPPEPKYPTPDHTTPDADLLDMIDDCMRNGRLMTRGNLAFSLLCERLGYDRDKFPTFLSWYEDDLADDDADTGTVVYNVPAIAKAARREL